MIWRHEVVTITIDSKPIYTPVPSGTITVEVPTDWVPVAGTWIVEDNTGDRNHDTDTDSG